MNKNIDSFEYKLSKILELATLVFVKTDPNIVCTIGMYSEYNIYNTFQLWIDKVDENTLEKSTFLQKTFTESDSFEECYRMLYSKLEKLANIS